MFVRIMAICLWIIVSSIAPVRELKPVFGLQIRHFQGAKMHSFVAFIDNGVQLTYKKILTDDDFVKFASGHWPSIYNPQRINLFDENEVGCGMFKDSFLLKAVPYCFPIDSLWKVRFSEYPFKGKSEGGWSGDYNKPSLRQAKFLGENYLVKNVDNDYFLDTNLWKILRDVRDPVWIENYNALR
ncbi:MAG: hypothetical protein PHQ74_01190 [Crocinitomicaceae bacterium]|nr:hypothetical protein [Crocinitomicaceae bacterium]